MRQLVRVADRLRRLAAEKSSWKAVWVNAKLALLKKWYEKNTGPRVALTKTFTGTYIVNSVTAANDLVGTTVTGLVEITVSNVFVRDFKVIASGGGTIIDITGGLTGVELAYFEIDGSSDITSGSAIGGGSWANVWVHHGNIHHTLDAVRACEGSTYEYLYIHDTTPYADYVGGQSQYHNDGFQVVRGAKPIRIRRNYVDHSNKTGISGNNIISCILIKTDSAAISDVIVEENYLNGGAYTIIIEAGANGAPTNITVRNNRFGRDYRSGIWSGAGVNNGADYVRTGNVWEDNRQPVTLTWGLLSSTQYINRGIAVAGAEFQEQKGVGVYGTDWQYDRQESFDYIKSKDLNLVRLAFRWERVQPTRGAALDPVLLNRLKDCITRINNAGLNVVLDMHNYCRRFETTNVESLMGRDFPASDLVDVWSRLSAELKGMNGIVGYGIMNEPHTLPGVAYPTGSELIGNPGFETDTTGWAGEGSTLTRDTAVFRTGVASMRVTSTAANDPNGRAKFFSAPNAITGNAKYAIGYYARHDATTAPLNSFIGINWYDSSYGYLDSTYTDYRGGTADEWSHHIVEVTSPVNAAIFELVVGFQPTAAGQQIWVDDVTFAAGTVISGADYWEDVSQDIVNAIRANNDTTPIYMPGYNSSGARYWSTYHPVPWITDSANAIVYEGHYYFDANNSGRFENTYAFENSSAIGEGYASLVDKAVTELSVFTNWCTTHNVKGFIGEFGWPNTGDTASWNAVGEAMYDVLDAVKMPATYWATGEFWGDLYLLSAYVGINGPLNTAKSQAPIIEAHNKVAV